MFQGFRETADIDDGMMDMCDLKRVNDGILIERKNTHSALLKPV